MRLPDAQVSQRFKWKNLSKMAHRERLLCLGRELACITHEINNPLTIAQLKSEQIALLSIADDPDLALISKTADELTRVLHFVGQVTNGVREFAKGDSRNSFQPTCVQVILEEVKLLCSAKLKRLNVQLEIGTFPDDLTVNCHAIQIEQVILNLVYNACDAILNLPEKWIKIEVINSDTWLELSVTGLRPLNQTTCDQTFWTGRRAGLRAIISTSNSLGDLYPSEECSLSVL